MRLFVCACVCDTNAAANHNNDNDTQTGTYTHHIPAHASTKAQSKTQRDFSKEALSMKISITPTFIVENILPWNSGVTPNQWVRNQIWMNQRTKERINERMVVLLSINNRGGKNPCHPKWSSSWREIQNCDRMLANLKENLAQFMTKKEDIKIVMLTVGLPLHPFYLK